MTATKEYIELNRNLHGWGNQGDILEVSPSDAVDALLENQLATRVFKKDLDDHLIPEPVSDAENPDAFAAEKAATTVWAQDGVTKLGVGKSAGLEAVEVPEDLPSTEPIKDEKPAKAKPAAKDDDKAADSDPKKE